MKSFKVAQVLILVYFENIEKCLKFASKTAGRNLEFCLRNDRPPCNNKVKILMRWLELYSGAFLTVLLNIKNR